MTGDNTDKNTEDDDGNPGYHTYPYSYDNNEDDSDISAPSDNTVTEVSEDDMPGENKTVAKGSSENVSQQAKDNTEDSASGSPAYVAPETLVKEPKIESQTEKRKNYTRASPEPPVAKRKSRKWQYFAIVAVLLVVIGASFAAIYQAFNGDIYSSNDKVAVIYIQGTLVTSSLPGGLGYASSEEISDNIRRALRDEDVKAIVLRINSGGGASTAGEEIYTEVKKASDSGVPIVVSMGSTAASAAYHLSAPADLIVSNPTTLTGSIGSLMVFSNYSEYYDEEGVEFEVIKSGEFKDMSYPYRGLSNDEREYANKLISQTYNQFIKDVAEGRDMSLSEVKRLADGRVYTGSDAKELGLVDEMGNLYDAIDMAADIGGIEGDPTIVYMNKPSLSSILFSSEAGVDVTSDDFINYVEGNPYGYLE